MLGNNIAVNYRINAEPQIFFHLKLVGKITLLVGAAACGGLLLMLMSISHQSGSSYAETIHSFSLTREHLGAALLVAGFFLVAFAAVIAWLITLYSSFRIAGPLFRFSRNLEMSIAPGPTTLVPIRKGDSLQEEYGHLEQSIHTLQAHYGALREAAGRAAAILESGDKHSYPEAVSAIAKLKELDSHVRL